MLSFWLLAPLALANMGPPPDIPPPCSVRAMCGGDDQGGTCTHPPQQDPPCPALAERGLQHACTMGLPDLEGNIYSVYCAPTAQQPTTAPASVRRCGAAGAAAVIPMLLLGLRRREDVRQL